MQILFLYILCYSILVQKSRRKQTIIRRVYKTCKTKPLLLGFEEKHSSTASKQIYSNLKLTRFKQKKI